MLNAELTLRIRSVQVRVRPPDQFNVTWSISGSTLVDPGLLSYLTRLTLSTSRGFNSFQTDANYEFGLSQDILPFPTDGPNVRRRVDTLSNPGFSSALQPIIQVRITH